jgi:hypothetical protein
LDYDKASELSHVVREIAEERGGVINRSRFGWWIKRHEGRFVANRRIIPDKSAGGNAKVWRIGSGSSGSSAFSATEPKVSNARSPARTSAVNSLQQKRRPR